MDFSKRWSFNLSDPDASLPRGSFEYFEQAINCLHPKSLHQRDAAPNACTCFQCAGAAIQNLAVTYNAKTLLAANAPRAKDVVVQIEAVRDGAQQLLNCILALDDYARAQFQKYGGASSLDLPLYSGYFDEWDEEDPEESDYEWVRNLSDLIKGANATLTGFRKSRGIGKNQRVDKGGNTNLFKEEKRSPDFNFVVDGWNLFEKFKPNEARGTEGGSFHLFLQYVYEYATGLEAEEHSSLSSWVKALAATLREISELSTKRARISSLRDVDDQDVQNESLSQNLREALDREILQKERVLLQLRPGKKPSQLQGR